MLETIAKWLQVKLDVDREYLETSEIEELESCIKFVNSQMVCSIEFAKQREMVSAGGRHYILGERKEEPGYLFCIDKELGTLITGWCGSLYGEDEDNLDFFARYEKEQGFVKIPDRLKFTGKAEDQYGFFGHSGYYGVDIYICKKSRRIYEVAPCHDICVCIIDIDESLDNFTERCGFMIPITVFCVDADPAEYISEISRDICRWEENPYEYKDKDMELYKEAREENN